MSTNLLDKRACCAMIGGNRPVHPATLYRFIRDGRWPKPLKLGKQLRRWDLAECEAALTAMREGTSNV